MKKLVLLFMLLAAARSFGAVATNVQNLSQFGKTNRAVAGDLIGLSTRASTPQERLLGLPITNLVTSLNTFGVGTNTVILAAGTNVVISTNRTSSNVTYTVSVTNVFASGADVVWTNNGGLIYPLPLNGQVTNSIQIYTNGGLSIGPGTVPYFGSQPGAGGEALISFRDLALSEPDFNEVWFGVIDGTNSYYHDLFATSSLVSRQSTFSFGPASVNIRDYVDSDGEAVFEAFTNASTIWRFRPLGPNNAAYSFDTIPRNVQTNRPIVEFANNSTNRLELLGDGTLYLPVPGRLGIGTNLPAYPLHIWAHDATKTAFEISYTNGAGNTVAMQIRNGTGATNFQVEVGGLVRSVTIANSGTVTSDVATATSLNVLGGTLGAGKVLTDVSGTGAATWQAGTSLSAVTNVVTNYISSVVANYMNLSVQAAKLPITNYPTIDAGWQNWELVFYRTNSVGFTNPLAASWQFIVPTNYFTNTMKVYGQSIILATNGPTSTNVVWRASFFKVTPGDSTDVHVGSFGSSVTATQTWAASNTGTNKVQDFLIDMSTNSLLQKNDFAILKLERVNDAANTNEMKVPASLIGLQLRY